MRRVSFVLVSLLVGCGGGKGAPQQDGAPSDGAVALVVDPDASCAPQIAPLEHVTSTFPASGATDVCTDAPLRMVFDTPPAIGTPGTIQVHQASTTTPAADSTE